MQDPTGPGFLRSSKLFVWYAVGYSVSAWFFVCFVCSDFVLNISRNAGQNETVGLNETLWLK